MSGIPRCAAIIEFSDAYMANSAVAVYDGRMVAGARVRVTRVDAGNDCSILFRQKKPFY